MEVKFEPYDKLTFKSYFEYETPEKFVEAIALPNPEGMIFQARLFWANGVLFRPFNHPPSESLAKEVINGHIILDHVEFAPMPTFQKEIKHPARPLGTINVVDVSKHIVFGPLAMWIKENLVKK